MDKVIINVDGMSDIQAQDTVTTAITGLSGVKDVRMSPANNSVTVEYDSDKVTNSDIKNAIIKIGYSVTEEKNTYKK